MVMPEKRARLWGYWGANLGDHANAAVDNMTGGQPALERAVHYNSLSAESAAELNVLAHKVSDRILGRLNQRASRLQKRDAAEAAHLANHRMRFGVYFMKEPEGEE